MNAELTILNQRDIREDLSGLTKDELLERIKAKDEKASEDAKYISNETHEAFDIMKKIKDVVYRQLEIDNSKPLPKNPQTDKR